MRLFIFFLFLAPLFADEEIIVQLSSQENLAPLYLAPIRDQTSGFDTQYLRGLEETLRFDFEHDGKIRCTSSPSEQIRVELSVHNRVLSVKLIDATTGTVRGLEGIVLCGSLKEDRRTIHRLHDTIFETLFQMPGVADTHILYTVRTRHSTHSNQWSTEVWEADYDGCNAHQLTQDGSLCVTPTFIPAQPGEHATHFLYVSYQIGQPKIYAASLAGGVGRRLTYLKGNQLMPALSPMRDKMAFISDVTGNPDLFIQDFSPELGLIGKPSQIFCAPQAAQGTPTFSPDGKRIAFVSNKDGTPRIYVLEIPEAGASMNALKPRLISKQTRNNTCPAWSPDGTKIAYSGTTSGVRQIWIYDFLNDEEIQLTDGYGHKENPAWAPNSLHLLFNSSTPQASELFLINLNQKKAVKLPCGPGEKRFPAWESIMLNPIGKI